LFFVLFEKNAASLFLFVSSSSSCLLPSLMHFPQSFPVALVSSRAEAEAVFSSSSLFSSVAHAEKMPAATPALPAGGFPLFLPAEDTPRPDEESQRATK